MTHPAETYPRVPTVVNPANDSLVPSTENECRFWCAHADQSVRGWCWKGMNTGQIPFWMHVSVRDKKRLFWAAGAKSATSSPEKKKKKREKSLLKPQNCPRSLDYHVTQHSTTRICKVGEKVEKHSGLRWSNLGRSFVLLVVSGRQLFCGEERTEPRILQGSMENDTCGWSCVWGASE